MTTWTTIPNSAAGVGGIPSGTTITALRDNPVAIAEGATGAPRVHGKALGGVWLGSLTMTGTAGMGFTALDGVSLIRADIVVTTPNTGAFLRARYSNDNGATWGSWQNTTVTSDSGGGFGALALNLQTGDWSLYGSGAGATSGIHTVPTTANAFQLSWSTSVNTLYGQYYILGGV